MFGLRGILSFPCSFCKGCALYAAGIALGRGRKHPPGGLVTVDTGPACSEVQPLLSLSLWFQTQGHTETCKHCGLKE